MAFKMSPRTPHKSNNFAQAYLGTSSDVDMSNYLSSMEMGGFDDHQSHNIFGSFFSPIRLGEGSPKLGALLDHTTSELYTSDQSYVYPGIVTSPPFNMKGFLSPGFVRRSGRLATPNKWSPTFNPPTSANMKHTTSAQSPLVRGTMSHGPWTALPVPVSRAQRPLMPIDSNTRHTPASTEGSHHASSVSQYYSCEIQTFNVVNANKAAKILKKEQKRAKNPPGVYKCAQYPQGYNAAANKLRRASSTFKRGEYRCGKCGFFPKKEKHDCATDGVSNGGASFDQQISGDDVSADLNTSSLSYGTDQSMADDSILSQSSAVGSGSSAPVGEGEEDLASGPAIFRNALGFSLF